MQPWYTTIGKGSHVILLQLNFDIQLFDKFSLIHWLTPIACGLWQPLWILGPVDSRKLSRGLEQPSGNILAVSIVHIGDITLINFAYATVGVTFPTSGGFRETSLLSHNILNFDIHYHFFVMQPSTSIRVDSCHERHLLHQVVSQQPTPETQYPWLWHPRSSLFSATICIDLHHEQYFLQPSTSTRLKRSYNLEPKPGTKFYWQVFKSDRHVPSRIRRCQATW